MRDPKRIPKILKELGKIWKKYPDLRLGQFLLNLGFDFYHVEDNDLIKKLSVLYKKIDDIVEKSYPGEVLTEYQKPKSRRKR